MHDELFKMRAVVARYRAGPYVEARERFLRQASADEGRTRKTSGGLVATAGSHGVPSLAEPRKYVAQNTSVPPRTALEPDLRHISVCATY